MSHRHPKTRWLLAFLLLLAWSCGAQEEQKNEDLSRADALCASGKYREALAAYQAVLQSSPEAAAAHSGAGKCLIYLNRIPEALSLLQKAVKLPGADAENFSLLGQAYFWDASAVLRTPSSPRAQYVQVILQDAAISFGKAVERDASLHLAHYFLGKVKMMQNKADEAAASFEQAVKIKPDQASYHFELGTAYQKTGKFSEGAKAFKEAAGRSPKKFKTYIRDARVNAAFCYAQAGMEKEAISAYKAAYQADPKNQALFQNLWSVYGTDPKRQMGGIRVLKALARARSSAALPYYYLGCLHETLGNKAETRKAFEKVLKSREGKGFSSAWSRLGVIYYKEDADEKKSEQHLLKALELNPRDENASQFLQFLAAKAKDDGRPARFVEINRKILKYQPENGKVWNHLAWYYHSRRNLKEAMKHYVNALKFAPKNPEIKYGAANAYNDTGKFNMAQKIYEEAVALKPDYVDAWKGLGWLYRRTGQLVKAKGAFEKVLELDPNQMGIRRDLEGIKRRLGEK